jgi:cellulose synthase/poly-beta-1,6-N-acetylglucosamine synthase-like glycosyltransferase
VGYPVVLYFLGRAKHPTVVADKEPFEPLVTLVVSAYNEDAVIRSKLENALALQYPPHLLEILVVSDASSDLTDTIVHEFSARESRIRLLRQTERRGKSAGLNSAVREARGDIVVFSDANAIYDEDAVRELVGAFRDPDVGYVVGAALYYGADGNRAAEHEGLYWKLEIFLKELESNFYSVVGGDGAIYAARRQLVRPLRDDDISDFVTTLQIIAQGFRGLFNRNARCYEHAGESFKKEFGRKRRIVNRSWRAYRRYGSTKALAHQSKFLFMLISHKVLRWFALPLIATAWLVNTTLLTSGWLYVITWAGITATMLLAVYGARLDRMARRPDPLTAFCYYFYLVNLAAALGVWDEARGVRHVMWDHIRKPQP